MGLDGLPVSGRSAKNLGVRVDGGNPGVHPSATRMVSPGEGMSAATSPGDLPVHRRPVPFGGTGKNMEMFAIREQDLPDGLTAVQDRVNHVTIGPEYVMPLAQFEGLLASTRNLWRRVEP